MNTPTTSPKNVRRFLSRGLATGLLFAQSALMLSAQPTTAATDKNADGTDKVVQLETFKVTAGFSGSLAAAADMKQKQTLISEVIAAEDIGKLPDISIAEALTRLPGVTTQRLNGRAQAIVIRGLNGDFSTALLNGRQQVSTGAGRAVEFDQYPAELLSSVVVYKATDASLAGQGLAGTVDLQTVRPLNSSTRTLAVNAFYEWNSLGAINAGAKSSGNRTTLSYVDQFMDGKLGLAIGYSRSDRPGQGYQWNAWGYPDTGPGQPLTLGGAKPFVRSSQIKRDGTMAVIEFKPNDNIHSTVDLYYSDFQETQLLRGIEIPLWWSSAQLQAAGRTVQNGLITQGTYTNVYAVARNDIVARNDHLFAGGWNLEIGNKDGWKTDLDLSYSRVKRRDLVLETYSGYASNQAGTPETLTYTLGQGEGGATFTHLLDYSNATLLKLTGPQGWGSGSVPGGQVGFVKGPQARDEIGQYTLKTQHPMSRFFKRFEAGVTLNERNKYERETGPQGKEGFFLGLKNGATSAPLPASVGLTDLSFIGLGNFYSYDPLALFNSGFYNLTNSTSFSEGNVANNWVVTEKIWTGYVKFDIDHKMGSTPVTGNIGAQLINSDQSSSGLAVNGNSITPVSRGHKYTDFVPSLNLNFQLRENTVLRFSASRQLARQRMADMRAGNSYSYNQTLATSTDPLNGPWSANGGNPELEPWRSNSVDLSLEHYFKDRMGYWAVAAFNKDLVSYTYNQTQIVSFVGYPTGTSGSTPAIFTGRNNSPANGQGGYIRGVEFALSLPGEKFTPMLKGFGFVGSASFFRSSIQPDLGNPAQPLPGLSEKVATATFYYEAKSGFAARISARYRSDYRGDISTFGPRGENFRNLQAETNIDAQVSYAFKDGMFKGMTLIAQGYNLNDEPLFASAGPDTRLVQDYQRYGATYSVGASYKF